MLKQEEASMSRSTRPSRIRIATAALAAVLGLGAANAQAEVLFTDNFNEPNYDASTFNNNLAATQGGTLGIITYSTSTPAGGWQAQHGNGDTMLLAGSGGLPGGIATLNHDFSVDANAANAPLKFSFNITEISNGPDSSFWGYFGVGSTMLPGLFDNDFSTYVRENGAYESISNGGSLGGGAIGTFTIGSLVSLVVSDTAGTGSAFNGNGSKLVMSFGNTEIATYNLAQLSLGDGLISFGGYSFGAFNIFKVDNLAVETLATDVLLGTGDTSGTYSNPIGGSSDVTKVGAGTWVINSNNTSTGTVTVEGGILDVNGSMANNGAANVFIHKDANDDFDNGQAPELQRAVGGLTSVAGFGATEVGGLGTVVTILAGSTNDATSIDMAFRGRNDAIVAGETSLLSSDVLQLEGLDGVVFVLQMTYSEAAALANGQAETTLRLGYLNTLTNQWEDAINGNHGPNTGSFFLSSYLDAGSPLDLGAFGVDVVNNVVWAVLDHNSYFAVVPTPAALPAGALLMGLLVAVKRRRQA
jgi:autotransporter-associated beta strand protein